MLFVLTEFIGELRSAGVPVSMVEAIDATKALRYTDLENRGQLKATLGATLVKNVRHFSAFEVAFETYFSLQRPLVADAAADPMFGPDSATIGDAAGVGTGGGGLDLDDLVAALGAALRTEDDALMRAVVRQAVSRLSGMEPGRPVGGAYYLYRVLRQLGLDALKGELISELTAAAQTQLERRLAIEDIDLRLEAFREMLRAEIRARLVTDRGPQAVARTLRRPLLEDVDLATATREQLAEIEGVLHPLTRKLATRLAQRRRQGRQGRLDVRSTLRHSLSSGGIPIDPRFRRPRPGRAELVLISDISGSVSTFARFTMQVVFAIGAQLSRVRSFAFIDTVDEVTRFFGPGTDFGHAMRQMGTEAQVVWMDGHSDYGNSFGAFVEKYLEGLTPKSTVIVTGDARSNYHDPNVGALREIAGAAGALFWLNPENHRYWDTGDSVMGAYASVCDEVHEVRNLRQLEAFVERVALPTSRPFRRVV